MRISYLVAGCAAAALLSGCGDPDNETATNANGNIVAAVPVETVAVVDYDLTPEQQTRRDAVDMTAYRTEVQKYQDEDRNERNGDSGMSGDQSMADSGADNGTMGNMQSTAAQGQAANMSFDQLDRNGDGKLSVAEFAVYSVGLDADAQKPNDQNKPYATDDQLNRAADGFFHFDTNGDSYLQPDEFAAAKTAMASGGNR